MYRLDVNDYTVFVQGPDGKTVGIAYNVKDSLATILLNPQQKLNGTALLRSNKVAEKILASTFTILLEDAEYQLLRDSTERIEGFDRQDVELVQRIMEAEKVAVQEVPSIDPEKNKPEGGNR